MFNRDFDPLAILQSHEDTLNDLIKAHNELAQFAENLAESNVLLMNRVESAESELNRIYIYIGENLQ